MRTLLTQRGMAKPTKGQMKQARAEMEPQYRWLVQLLNAYALIDQNEQRYAALIGALNQNIDYLKNVVLARQGGSEDEPEDGSEDGSQDGGGSDGGSSDVTPVTPEPTPSGDE